MKLYTAPYAPNPRRVIMFMAEKQIRDIEFAVIDLTKGEHRAPDFRAISPLSQVPALVLDDGRVLTESRAICAYLEALYPAPNLMGADAEARAFIEMWDRRMEQLVFTQLMMWVRHGSPALAAVERNQSPDMAEFFRNNAMQALVWLDRELANRPWIAGDQFSIADITAACGVDFAKLMKWRPGDKLPNLQRWRAALDERPAGKAPA